MNKTNIDCEYVEELVCPWCGYSWEDDEGYYVEHQDGHEEEIKKRIESAFGFDIEHPLL